jgi:hypothetical protein
MLTNYEEKNMSELGGTRYLPWATAKPEELASVLSISTADGEFSTDEPVKFLERLEQMNPAALWAIWLELATWSRDPESRSSRN